MTLTRAQSQLLRVVPEDDVRVVRADDAVRPLRRVPFLRDPATPGVGEAIRVRSACTGRRRAHPDRDLDEVVREPDARCRDRPVHGRSASLPPARAVRRAAGSRGRSARRSPSSTRAPPTTRTRWSSAPALPRGRRDRLLDWRQAVAALAAILAAGWTVFLRAPDVPVDGGALAQLPAHRRLRDRRRRDAKAFRAGTARRGAGPPDRAGGAASRRGGAEPDHPRAARRARALGQRDDGPGERRPPAAETRAAARARGL